MWFGLVSLVIAVAAAGWLLFRLAAGDDSNSDKRSMTILKGVVWLALTAALLAAKLWPLAFMVLIAAGGVTAIEAWRGSQKDLEEDETSVAPSRNDRKMSEDEALSVLGLEKDADAGAVRAAHRKLISQLHPDRGGTDYLASKINEARDFLLRRLGEG
ncbi:hypothetical protein PUV54_01095 [Hyphococcus flavus]|uniref:J domain-containing protein n=1 Tax=Hyphococcus flavus TaxID=1866326 RepID=A0AAF0CET0_9PROT|nr:hypothetical protein [Hyphococcus flavus]WDI31781.1 hypothetical protein PUV54_01095 [Hyphococcus flavus]